MSIWSKVLIGLIAVVSLAFFYLAMRALKTHQAWHGEVAKYEKAIADAAVSREAAEKELRNLRPVLHSALVDRGRIWRDAIPGPVNPQTGDVTITFTVPPATPIDDKAVLFVFDQPEPATPAAAANPLEEALQQDEIAAPVEPAEGQEETGEAGTAPAAPAAAPTPPPPPPAGQVGAYLGQFKVVGIGETGIALAPANKLSPTALQRLIEHRGPWMLADVLRSDRHDIFDPENPDHMAMLPEATRREYEKDGKDADPNDPPEQVVEGKFVRKLRDYDVIFREDARLRTIEIDQLEAAKKDLAYVTAAHKAALAQEQSRRDQIAALETELAKYTRERDAVVQHEEQVAARLAEVQAGIDRLFAENKRLAAELAELQSARPAAAAVRP
ncbi:MAG: hypothetical protein KF708_21620 [Pirellulales bacterium]|nr:hypothetical protein [Pirellulales bacterium]